MVPLASGAHGQVNPPCSGNRVENLLAGSRRSSIDFLELDVTARDSGVADALRMVWGAKAALHVANENLASAYAALELANHLLARENE